MINEIYKTEDKHSEMGFDPNEELSIVLVFPDGKRMDYKALFRTTIKGLKLSIDQSKIIPKDQYYLTLVGRCLHDNWVLGEVGVKNGSELVVVRRTYININIEFGDEGIFELNLPSDSLIGDLKQKLIVDREIKEYCLDLFFNDKECNNDDVTLFELGILDGSVINVRINDNILLYFKYESTMFSCIISSSSKIEDLKKLISQSINISADELYICCDESRLWREDVSLESYGVSNYSCIDVRIEILGD